MLAGPPRVTGKGASTTIAFRATRSGDFAYYCSVPGHRLAGMEGQFIVTPRPSPQTVVEADISREPGDLPAPIGKRDPQTIRVDFLSVEVKGRLAEGTTFGYWTFNGKVPGPFIRVQVGDTVDIHLKNSADSAMIHSVDFHAATGPGGGAAALQVDPGRREIDDLEGAGARPVRLSLRHAKVGDTVRIFFGVGGPNYTSSFHVIGEIFDKVYNLGGLTTAPLEGIQTLSVPAGGAVITEFKLDLPGNCTLVDHALARMERGLPRCSSR